MKDMKCFGTTLTRAEKRNTVFNKKEVIGKQDGLDKTKPVFGIDLGTTNSAISVITVGSEPTTIELKQRKMTMPSCVMWRNGEFIVGREAYEHREQANVIYSVKRWMQEPTKTVKFNDRGKILEMRPAEVSAEILKGLVNETQGFYGDIEDVVVTVPAYFDQNGRDATMEACKLAGLNCIHIIPEPTAASICLDANKMEGDQDFIVFDFGGGTFDVTLSHVTKIKSEDNVLKEMQDLYDLDEEDTNAVNDSVIFRTIATDGDSYLGGDDIDRELLELVGQQLEKRYHVKLTDLNRTYREKLLLRLEQFKKVNVNSTYELQVVTNTNDGRSLNASILVTVNEFAKALDPIYRRCKKKFDKLLAENECNVKNVFLVGGSTKNPLLVERLRKDYPQFVFTTALHADLAVTKGAAKVGKIEKFGDEHIKYFDVLPISIGIVGENSQVHRIIAAGETLPVTKSMAFTNVVDGQKTMKLTVVQGESKYKADCVILGELEFTNLPDVKAGKARLGVSISVSAKSVMTCKGIIDGKEKVMTLSLSGDVSRNTNKGQEKLVNRLMKKAEILHGEDRRKALDMLKECPMRYSISEVGAFIAKCSGASVKHSKI